MYKSALVRVNEEGGRRAGRTSWDRRLRTVSRRTFADPEFQAGSLDFLQVNGTSRVCGNDNERPGGCARWWGCKANCSGSEKKNELEHLSNSRANESKNRCDLNQGNRRCSNTVLAVIA